MTNVIEVDYKRTQQVWEGGDHILTVIEEGEKPPVVILTNQMRELVGRRMTLPEMHKLYEALREARNVIAEIIKVRPAKEEKRKVGEL